MSTDVCAICSEIIEREDELYFLQCLHKFHIACISKWLTIKLICPVCKFPSNIEIIDVDKYGKFISSSGHEIDNGIINDKNLVRNESVENLLELLSRPINIHTEPANELNFRQFHFRSNRPPPLILDDPYNIVMEIRYDEDNDNDNDEDSDSSIEF
jgi:hypothetical protein